MQLEFLDQWLSPEALEFVKGRTFLTVAGSFVLLYVLAWCRVFARAGHHSVLGFFMLLPGVNFFMLLVLAFASWPRERELRALRKVQRASRDAEGVYRRAA
jgi:hypothetical protein